MQQTQTLSAFKSSTTLVSAALWHATPSLGLPLRF